MLFPPLLKLMKNPTGLDKFDLVVIRNCYESITEYPFLFQESPLQTRKFWNKTANPKNAKNPSTSVTVVSIMLED